MEKQDIPIRRIIRSGRRTLRLEIDSDASLVVRAPAKCPDRIIQQVVEKHRNWILSRQAYARVHFKRAAPLRYAEGGEFLYLGKKYKLIMATKDNAPLSWNGAYFIIGSARMEQAPAVFEKWYRQAAFKVLSERAGYYSSLVGTDFNKIRISSARQRWGSCSGRGNLSFTWRLIMAPLEVIDYIVIHELVHVTVKNHSRDFWQKVREYSPGYKEIHRWLKDNQHLLAV